MADGPILSRRDLIAGSTALALGGGAAAVASGVLVPGQDGGGPATRGSSLRTAVRRAGPSEEASVRDARFGAGLTPDGRARLPLHSTARRIWLDTVNGSDNASGSSPSKAIKSEELAYKLWNSGDQLMVASDSILTVACGDFRVRSGHSPQYPTVLQSYDRRAPQDETRYGLLANRVWYRGVRRMFEAFSRSPDTSHVAVRGIGLDHTGNAMRGVSYPFTIGIDWLLLEQCAFLASGLALNNGLRETKGHVIRQCIFDGNWRPDGKAQGIYTSRSVGTVIEDCVFNHCGWRRGIDRSANRAEGGPTIFSHGIYAQCESNGVLRRSLFVQPASHGAQLRGSWVSHDNVFMACPLALLHGGGTDYGIHAPDGVMAECYRNLVTVAEDISPTSLRGIGIIAENTRPGSVIEHCLLAGPRRDKARQGFQVLAEPGPKYEPNPTIIDFVGNTNAWSPLPYLQGARGTDQQHRITIGELDNIAQDDKVGFVDPARDGMSAIAALGLRDFADFDKAISADASRPWALEIAKHIRPGFAPHARSMNKVRNPDGTIKGAVLPNGEWNDGKPWRG